MTAAATLVVSMRGASAAESVERAAIDFQRTISGFPDDILPVATGMEVFQIIDDLIRRRGRNILACRF
jgi:hypothetical protein